jgi:hypothetical protein
MGDTILCTIAGLGAIGLPMIFAMGTQKTPKTKHKTIPFIAITIIGVSSFFIIKWFMTI